MSYVSDTSPEIESVQIALFRKASVTQRLMCMQSLSQSIAMLSRRAIARNHPEFDQQERDIFFVGLHYGNKLADGLRSHLNQRTT